MNVNIKKCINIYKYKKIFNIGIDISLAFGSTNVGVLIYANN